MTNIYIAMDDDNEPKVSSHCYIEPNQIFGGYQISKFAGKGRWSKVWLGNTSDLSNGKSQVAIKVYRTGEDNTEEFLNEIKIYNLFKHECTKRELSSRYVLEFLGAFVHIAYDRMFNARLHPCVVFKAGHETLSSFVKYCKRTYDGALPTHVVKCIMRQVMSALATMHSCSIIHADIKPSNILLARPISEYVENPESSIEIIIADLGGSIIDDNYANYGAVGTTQYMAPEIIIEMPYSFPIDIWSACVMCFKLLTGEFLFDVYAECDIFYGDDVDDQGLEGLELITGNLNINETNETNDCESNDESSGESSGESSDESSDSSDIEEEIDLQKINYRHLLLIAKVLGYPPNDFTSNARLYYNRHDRLMNNPDIEPITIYDLLASNYDMDDAACRQIEEFLLLGLKYMPEDRVTAAAVANCTWLSTD